MWRFFAIVMLWLATESAHAQSVRDEYTAGTMALRYRRENNTWFQTQIIGVDASTTTSPPDATFLDRRIENSIVAGKDAVINDRFGIRVASKGFFSFGKRQEKEPPISPQTSRHGEVVGLVDLTYINHKGLELFVGQEYHAFLPATIDRDSGIVSSHLRYNAGSYLLLRAGLMRRGSSWSGGFYFVSGEEDDRDFTATASDGTSSQGTSKVYTPTEYGIVTAFDTAAGSYEIDLAMVQAGEGGERSDLGTTIHDDFLRLRLGLFYPLGGGGILASLAHQTLSYSNNAFTTIDTIPFTYLKLAYALGGPFDHFHVGVILGQGKDRTSITEFNASYEYQSVGLITGLFVPL